MRRVGVGFDERAAGIDEGKTEESQRARGEGRRKMTED